MSKVESLMADHGLVLPEPMQLPPGAIISFPWVRVRGNRAFISGHAPLNPDGSIARPLGKVGADLTKEEAYVAARLTGLAILSSLKRELGDLDRVKCWLKVLGLVNCAPGFNNTPYVINGFTDLIVELYGPELGVHARSAIGVAELPFGIPVEIEGEVEIG